MDDLEKFKAQKKVEEQNKAIVTRYWNGKWNERRPAILDEIVAKDIKHHGEGQELNGIEEYRNTYKKYLTVLTKTRFEIQTLIAEGDRVMSLSVWSGVYDGSLGDIFPVGKEFSGRFFTVFKLSNGQIVEEWELHE
jgi:predicted ester cyclase